MTINTATNSLWVRAIHEKWSLPRRSRARVNRASQDPVLTIEYKAKIGGDQSRLAQIAGAARAGPRQQISAAGRQCQNRPNFPCRQSHVGILSVLAAREARRLSLRAAAIARLQLAESIAPAKSPDNPNDNIPPGRFPQRRVASGKACFARQSSCSRPTHRRGWGGAVFPAP